MGGIVRSFGVARIGRDNIEAGSPVVLEVPNVLNAVARMRILRSSAGIDRTLRR